MPKASTPENFKRYRFSVPNADTSVTSWIEKQSNLSCSIRELIKIAIRCNGFTDVSCYPVQQIAIGGPMGSFPIEYALLSQANGGPVGFPQNPAMAAPQVQPQASAPAAYPQTVPAQAPMAAPMAAPTAPVSAPVSAPAPAPVAAPGPEVTQQQQMFADPAALLDM